MIKFVARKNDGNLILGIGLSKANTEKLVAGQPILIPYETLAEYLGLALSGIEEFDLLLLGGETEDDIKEELEPLISPNTIVREQ